MKKIVVVAGLVAVMSAVALGADRGGQSPYPYPVPLRGGQKPKWTDLTAYYSQPGLTGLLRRLDLAPDQEKVLDEIFGEWVGKQQKASAEVTKKVPTLTAEDYKDEAKRKDYYEKYQAAMKEAVVPFPADQIMNVLTPDQAQKVNEANAVIAAWGKTVGEILAKHNKQLDETVGPAVTIGTGTQALASTLDNYKKGTSGLADRLGITKEQTAALWKLSAGTYGVPAGVLLISAAVAESKLPDADRILVSTILNSRSYPDRTSQLQEKIAAVLTEDQRARIDKGLPLVEERNKVVNASYDECAAKVEKILPEPKKQPAAPAAQKTVGPGAGGQ